MTGPVHPALRIAALTTAAALALSASSAAIGQCIPGIACPFTVKGKKGPFVQAEVTSDILAKADKEVSTNLANGETLNAASINKGANSGAGISMPLTEKALFQILDRVRTPWPYRAPPSISLRMTGTAVYSPVAHPDNVIVIPVGLLMHAQSDDEVAWVVAHEFAHIAMAHFSRAASQRRLRSNVDRITGCAQLGLMLADVRISKNGNNFQAQRANDKHLAALSTQIWAKENIVDDFLEIYNQGLSRRHEDQADALGIDLALKAGYSDAGFGTALAFLQQEEARAGTFFEQFGNEFSGYMKVASGQALAQFADGGNASNIFQQWTDGLMRNAESIIFKKIKNVLTASHRPAKQRQAGMTKYMDNAYAAMEPKDPTESWLGAVRMTPEFKEAEVTVRAVDSARAAIPAAPCDLEKPECEASVSAGAGKALAAVQPALTTRYRGTPLVANTVAFLNYALGNLPEADRMYDIADRVGTAPPPAPAPAKPVVRKGKAKAKVAAPALSPQPAAPFTPDPYMQQSLDGFDEHVKLLVRMKNYTKALTVIAMAKSRFQDDNRFLPSLITIAAQTKDVDRLTDAVQRCYASSDPALVQACEFSFMNPQQQDQFAALSPADQDKLMGSLARASADARKGTSCGLPSATEVKAAEKGVDIEAADAADDDDE
ncbi:M48 family metalloprotease [Sphingobium rhizovicinum]|uniref:M48 family metalloprotease n=1 Tax=Sphingobium rhizovicinum TaxID=432308 RepID=A0ABV7NF03_9SPHN